MTTSRKKSSTTADKSDLRVAIRIDCTAGTNNSEPQLVRIRAVEFNDKAISKSKGFDEKATPFTAELAAKFVKFVGNRKTYGDSPYARHVLNDALRSVDVIPPAASVYSYNYYKRLHPSESKEFRGQHPLSVITTKYPTGQFQGAKQLAKAIILMRNELREKNISPDNIDAETLTRKAKKNAVSSSAASHHEEKTVTPAPRVLPAFITSKLKDQKCTLVKAKNAPEMNTSDMKAAQALVSLSMFKGHTKPSAPLQPEFDAVNGYGLYGMKIR